MAVIKLRRSSGMQTNCRASFILGDPAGGKKRQVVRIDAEAKLDRYRHIPGIFHSGPIDVPQQVLLQRDRGAATFSSDFWDGTPEMHIKRVDASFIDQTLHIFGYVI